MPNKITIKDLVVEANNEKIIDKLNVEFKFPGITLLKGENGSGKSTLFHSIFNNPNYNIKSGEVLYEYNNKVYNLLELSVNEIAKLDIFLSFQNPVEIPGLSLRNFLLTIYKEKFNKDDLDVFEFNNLLISYCDELDLKKELLDRDLNKDYSGGEKKKVELLQILLLNPKVLLLDEIDTGVDVKSITFFINKIQEMKDKGVVIVSHNKSFLKKLNIKDEYKIERGRII